ncbi:hypothetical protein EKO04_005673 [Ascochyta lentis]|uniref:Xylanolytic transcriptional activator regulatory domain-containing protein n=1 Tax=Ascochyta lentis TaxID=205686 RepID=A0A8H7MHL5_9PLEO|nr:hypothetical protein EKO04_005673 [Ascochyta lentis]
MSTLQKPQNALLAKQPIRDVSARCELIKYAGVLLLSVSVYGPRLLEGLESYEPHQRRRISQVEQKIDGLVASLVNPVAAAQPTANTAPGATEHEQPSVLGGDFAPQTSERRTPVAPGNWLLFPSSFEQRPQSPEKRPEQVDEGEDATDRQYIEQIRNIHSFDDHGDIDKYSNGLFKASKRNEEPIEDPLINDLLTTGEADSLLDEYRKMSQSFPFVPLGSTVTARKLYQEAPMLFLATMTAASWREHQRQLALDAIYRQELASRTIVRPRKNLSLVQSVLVYLSWYHFVFSHKTQQIFFLHHLVVGLALDIGLHCDFQPISFVNRRKPQQANPQEKRERQRAFLGCYYLASMVSAALQKPNLLKYSSEMTEWAQDLKSYGEFETDKTIEPLISLRQLDDQVQDTLFTGAAAEASLADSRMAMHVRFLETQLDAWRRGCDGVGCHRMLSLSYFYTDMVLHTVALRPLPESVQPTAIDATHLKALLSALEAAKQFFDALLSFPASEYHLISFSEWIRLPAAMMFVAKLCIPTNAHAAAGWDVKAAQDVVRLETSLEALCYRFQNQTTYDKVKQPHPDFWWAMRFVTDLTRDWYVRKINQQVQSDASNRPTSCENTANHLLALPTPPDRRTQNEFADLANMDFSNDTCFGAGEEGEDDPFAFMKSADFDMEQFFELGIWGDEAYKGMSFGGSGMSF